MPRRPAQQSGETILTYDEVRREIGERRSYLLLGNGFSIACDPVFRYGSLYEAAVQAGLSERAQQLFERIGTNNFEGAMKLLEDSHWVARTYGLLEYDSSDMLNDLDVIKRTLVDAREKKRGQATFPCVEVRRSATFALMPRIPRGQVAGHAYHVLNRGNGGATVFHKDGDYVAFLHLLGSAKLKFPVKVLGFCLMPNHFHLVVQPATNVALSSFMQWWMTSHVRRYHKHYQSQGHVWQGRFKCFPIQQDEHLLTVLRYVYRNPVRAGLVATVMEWPWSSLRWSHLSDPLPLEMPRNWLGLSD